MQIRISARHGHLSDPSQEKIQAKLDKLGRIFERLTAIEATINLENPESLVVDLKISAEHKHDFVATEQGPELMGVVDGAVHKIEQQLRKYKEKIVERHRTPGHGTERSE